MDRALLRLGARLAFGAAALGAYVLAILPGSPEVFTYDKSNHVLAFSTLGLLARLGWPRAPIWKIVAGLIGFGAFIELSQALPIVHRDASWLDLLADALALAPGLLVGVAAVAVARRVNWPDWTR